MLYTRVQYIQQNMARKLTMKNANYLILSPMMKKNEHHIVFIELSPGSELRGETLVIGISTTIKPLN